MIAVDREKIKQWLYALEQERNNYFHGETDGAPEYLYEAIAAIKEALAQPEQEPDDGYCKACDGWKCTAKAGCVALDNPPPQLKEPEQEPVAWSDSDEYGHIRWRDDRALDDGTPLYTTPPQRTLVGLTDDEIVDVVPESDTPMSLGEAFHKFAKAIEAKLKEKNT